MSQEIETRQDYEGAQGKARYWHIELDSAEDEEREWRKEAKEVIERYRAEKSLDRPGREKRFNILWSNTETLKGALFAKMAKPDVRRRYLDPDPASRQLAIMIERALEYANDVNDERDIVAASIEDYLLPGRGVVWVCKEDVVVDGEIGDQRCWFEYVHWEDYRESPAKRPEDVRWKARKHLKTREQIRDEYPDHADKVPLNWSPKEDDKSEVGDVFKRAEVWEVWCKETLTRYWVVKGYPAILKQDDDPYQLEKFFPTPNPLVSVRTNGKGVPIPEFRLYSDQADELDRITTRIARLTDALRRRGVYDAAIPELVKLAEAGDNVFVPAENYASLAQKGGLQQAMQQEDITITANVLVGLYQQRDQLIQTIYEVTGISDVIRGATDPDETATAQKLKGQFGSMRLKQRQDAVQRFIRDLYRIRAELIAEHYEPHVLGNMTGIKMPTAQEKQQAMMQAQMLSAQGQPVPPEIEKAAKSPTWDDVVKIMRSDKLRSYRIDIETDSTVFEDAEAEKKGRIEFVDTLGGFLEKALPVVQQAPELTALTFQAMEFMVRGWKIGREFEDVIEEAKQAVLSAQQQAQQQPQQDPKMIEVEMDAKAKQAEMQIDQKMSMAKMQQEGQLKAREQDRDFALKQRQQQIDAELEASRDQMRAEAEARRPKVFSI